MAKSITYHINYL